MSIDNFRVNALDRVILFVAAGCSSRFSVIEKCLLRIGSIKLGPLSFMVKNVDSLAEDICDALGELEEDECIYLIGSRAGEPDLRLLVRARTSGGIVVG